MNDDLQIYYWAHMLDEAFRIDENLYDFKSRFGKEPNFDEYFQKFIMLRNLHKIKSPFNDIGMWMKRPFPQFKAFLDKTDTSNKSERKKKACMSKAVEWGAVNFGEFGGYEAWYVPSYEAAVQLARFYGGSSTDWCIACDDPSYFCGRYKNSIFIFLINLSLPANSLNRKLAIELDRTDWRKRKEPLESGDQLQIVDVYDVQDNYLMTCSALNGETENICNAAADEFKKNFRSIKAKSDKTGWRVKLEAQIQAITERLERVMLKHDVLSPSVFDDSIYMINVIKIPENVKEIEDYTFSDMQTLEYIFIPASVQKIGKRAFEESYGITQAVFKGKTIDEIKSMANYPFGLEEQVIIAKS